MKKKKWFLSQGGSSCKINYSSQTKLTLLGRASKEFGLPVNRHDFRCQNIPRLDVGYLHLSQSIFALGFKIRSFTLNTNKYFIYQFPKKEEQRRSFIDTLRLVEKDKFHRVHNPNLSYYLK